MLYWLVDINDLTNIIESMLIKPGLSSATYSERIVRIDWVPVLQARCRAGSELELRGEGWDSKFTRQSLILLIVISIFTGSSTTLITEGNSFKGFTARVGRAKFLY